jgi:cytochrome c-type biogenesis protein CcmE
MGKHLRVSGKIADGTLNISNDRREATFVMTGTEHRLAVRCDGPLPDNLAEGREVVVEGHLQSPEHFDGQRVTTRCASKYAPKQATDNVY